MFFLLFQSASIFLMKADSIRSNFTILSDDLEMRMQNAYRSISSHINSFELSFFNSISNSLKSLDKINKKTANEIKSAEQKLGPYNTCLAKNKELINSAYNKAGDEISKCTSDILSQTIPFLSDLFNSFISPYQEPILNVPFIMLTDLSHFNPITQSKKLIKEIWPASYKKTHDDIRRNEYHGMEHSGAHSGITSTLNSCLKLLEESFIASKNKFMKEVNTKC